MAKYLNLAGLQTLWAKLKDTFALKKHSHDDMADVAPGGVGSSSWTDDQEIVVSSTYGYSASYKSAYRKKTSLLWNYIKSKLGISSAVGSTTNPVYVDSNGQLKAVSGTMLKQGSLIDTHSEGSRTIWIDGTNELFAFYDRGGTCTAYEYDLEWDSSSPAPAGTFRPADLSSHKTTASVSNISANVFNSLTGYNQSPVYSGTKYAVYDLKLPASFSYGTTFYWSFGNDNWKPHYFEVLVWKDNATQYPNGYISKYRSTSVGVYGAASVSVGATEGNSFTHIRIVMDKYSRLAAFGVVNFSSIGLATNYMSRTVDRSLYRSISVAKNNTYNLGSSSAKWANVYATNFNGNLSGGISVGSRVSSADVNDTGIFKILLSSTGMTTQKPITDGFILHFNWDSSLWATQLFLPSTSDSSKEFIQFRTRKNKTAGSAGAWSDWGDLPANIKGNAATASAAKSGSSLETSIAGKVTANTAITGATKCKITYDSKGLVTAGADLAASDIPNLAASKITSGTFADERIASASKWNAKQDNISDIIPTAASASNPLCDKAYADAIGERLEARYLGCNANGDPFATHAALTSATKFYYQGAETTPDTNDITTVVADEDHKNTSNVAGTTRYRYGGVDASGKPVWAFEYVINNTGLSEAQLLAVNSGITATKVTKYEGYASGKQDKLTAGSNISISGSTISATDTTYDYVTPEVIVEILNAMQVTE